MASTLSLALARTSMLEIFFQVGGTSVAKIA
jgi:hypothetical protein